MRGSVPDVESRRSGIGWFELICCCVATGIITAVMTLSFLNYRLGGILQSHGVCKAVVMDFQALAVGQYNAAQREVENTANADSNVASDIYRRKGEELGKLLRRLGDEGYVVLDKSKVLAFPARLDVTQALSKQLGLETLGLDQRKK